VTHGVDAPTHVSGGGTPVETWTVLRMILWSAEYLESKGVKSARLDAEHLLAHVLGVGRLEMYLQHERPLEPFELDGFRPLLKRKARREPLQYILGRQAFRELDLEVGPAVLIPRPETERLVEEVLEWARIQVARDLCALDLGTGSGAIALSLLLEGPFARVVATDISAAALELAARNRDAVGLGGRVDLRLGALFEAVETGECFDVVVSNPPYVAETERQALQPEVVDWEPGEALFGGPDGLSVLRMLACGAGAVVRPGGLLALEVGDGQAGPVVALLDETGEYDEVEVRSDLARKERIVMAKRAA